MFAKHHSMNLRNGKKYSCTTRTHEELLLPVNNTNKWLSDFQLTFYFDTFSHELSKLRKDVWFFNPSITHILKLGSVHAVTELMTSIDLDNINYAFICVSDGNSVLESSSHWSLMIYCKPENKIFHLDSIKGYNHQAAVDVVKNIGWSEETLIEVPIIQQMNSFECGLHVLVNTKHIISYFLNKSSTQNSLHDFLFQNTEECLKNSQEVKLKSLTKTNSLLTDNEYKKNNMVCDWQTVTTKSRSNQKLLGTRDITCVNRFSVLSSCNKTDITHDVVHNDNINYSPSRIKISTKQKNNNTKNSYSQEKFKKVKIITDSHGRKIRECFGQNSKRNYNVQSIIKPNAKSADILKDVDGITNDLDKNDFVFVMTGTNDIDQNTNIDELINVIEDSLKNCTKTNIIISKIPYRYDAPKLNHTIRLMNFKIKCLVDKYEHITLLSLHFLKRYHYTYHGLHLNSFGKKALTTELIDTMNDLDHIKEIPTLITNTRINKNTHIHKKFSKIHNQDFLGNCQNKSYIK